MSKEILFGSEARSKLLRGMEVVYKAVGSTMGPKGRCLVMERRVTNMATHEVTPLQPVISKDGISCARAISLPDAVENLGVDLIREASARTLGTAGDGTSAAVVLAYSLISNGIKALDNGASPVFLRSGIDKTVAKVIDLISVMSVSAEGREGQIARIAANGDDEIGNAVVEAVSLAGANGIVSVDASRTGKTYIEFNKGMRFDSGLRYQDFISNGERGECVLDNPFILIHERRLQSIASIGNLFQAVANSQRPLLILSEEFEIPVVGLLLANLAKLKSCPVVAPYFGERRRDFLKDLAVLTKGISITDELGLDLKNLGVEVLGQAEKVIVTKGTTTIIGGKGDPEEIKQRVAALKNAINKTDQPYEQEVLSDRLAKLDGGVSIIRVGGATESESKERRDRCEDAVLSVKCAKEDGVVAGGGVALLRCSEDQGLIDFVGSLNQEEKIGAQLVLSSLKAPILKILENGGYAANEVLCIIERNGTNGFDALNGKYVDMLEAGICDPAKVVKQALMNASSLAGTMLTTSGTIVNLPEGDRK